MSWIPIPPISNSDNGASNIHTASQPVPSSFYAYPPPMNLPTASFGSHPPPSAHQPHWMLPHGPQEELFPKDKIANLQTILNKCNDQYFIGLEYVVEIQHVDHDKRGSWYSCRLCEAMFQSKDGSASCIDSMRHHLTLASHKLNYLLKHFKTLKEEKLEPPKNVPTIEGIDKIVEKIERYFGRLKIHLVIGQNIFFINLEKIDKYINDGRHFEENVEFLDLILKKRKPMQSGKTTMYPSPERRNRTTSVEKEKNIGKDKDRNSSKKRESKKRERSRSRSRTKNKMNEIQRKHGSRSRSKSKEYSSRDKKKKLSKTSDNDFSRKGVKDRRYSRSKSRSRHPSTAKDRRRSQRSRSKTYEYTCNPTSVKIEMEKSSTAGHEMKRSSNEDSTKYSRSKSPNQNYKEYEKQKHTIRKSKSKSRSKVDVTNSVSSLSDKNENGRNQKSKGKQILSFLEEEVIMLKEMEQEKTLYYDTPSKHPLYESEWGKFWKKKFDELKAKGIDINGHNLTPEWIVEWRNFFDGEHAKKKSREREILLKKWDLESKDIEWFNSNNKTIKEKVPEVISLSDSDDDCEVVRSASPWEKNTPPPPVKSRPSTSKMSVVETERDPRRRKSGSKGGKDISPKPKVKVSTDDASILDTLRFLKNLETANLLGNLGQKVDELMETALGLEKDEYGSSQLLVDQNECHTFMDQAREMINHKLGAGLVPDRKKPVCRLTINNISILLRQSTCQENEILEIDNSTPSKPDTSKSAMPETAIPIDDAKIIKLKIAETISNELLSSGTQLLNQDEFNSLVEAEYVRIKHHLPSRSQDQDSLSKSLQSTFNISTENTSWTESDQSGSSDQQLFSAYTLSNTSANNHFARPPPSLPSPQFPRPPHFPRPPPNLARPQFSIPPPHMPISQPPSIDWNSLINIISSVKKKEEQQTNIVVENAPVKTEADPYDLLTEDEIVQLLKNFKELEEGEKKDFLGYMKKLENINPDKVKRLKTKMHTK